MYVTFEVFTNEIWPKMIKGRSSYNPALIWKEIKSFLKGSFEGFLGRLLHELRLEGTRSLIGGLILSTSPLKHVSAHV